MAASQLPRHDFAPAWLKLPNNENSAWKHGTGDRLFFQPAVSERSLGRQSRSYVGGRNGVAYDDMVAQPQLFHGHQFNRPRFYSNEYHDGDYEITLTGFGPRAGSRHGHNSRSHMQVNGLYPSEHQPINYNSSRHPPAVSNGTHSAPPKKPQRNKDGRSGSESGSGQRRKMDSTRTASSTSTAILDDEFPSLNGDASAAENSKPASNKVTSVWNSPSRQSKNINRSSGSGIEAGHKSLVLKTSSAKRWPTTNKTSAGIRENEKELVAPAEELNSCLVTHPKNIGDKKSNFLRSLRHSKESNQFELNGFEASHSEPTSPSAHSSEDKGNVFSEITNSNICDDVSESGIHEDMSSTNSVSSPIELILSSSHEAEQRLLREMGWKENDEEDEHYEITEADVREFENLRRRLQVSCSLSSKGNGFAHEQSKVILGRHLSLPIFIHQVPLPDLDADSEDDGLSDSSDDLVQKAS